MLQKWYVLDGTNKVLGRFSCTICNILNGKYELFYPNHLEVVYVVVNNACKIKFTGKKLFMKFYYNHSGFPGGLKKKSLNDLFREMPQRVLCYSVKGMLSKNSLGRAALARLKIYAHSSNLHLSQNLISFDGL